MVKRLSERVAERVRKEKPSLNEQNRAIFLAVRLEVKEALDDGWSVKSIWETLHKEGKVMFSYQAFRGYVNRLILTAPPDVSPPPVNMPATPGQSIKPKVSSKPREIPTFTFDPNANKKDLL